MSIPKTRSHPADRPVAFLNKVVGGDLNAWKQFVEQYSGFLYSLAWRYARQDVDVASELVLVALEGLARADANGQNFYRLRSYLDSLSRYGSRSRFTTWLALVVKNLFRDWFREREGRRLLPKEIEGLDAIDQEIFRLLFWEDFSESETFETVKNRIPDLSLEQFTKRLNRVHDKLTQKNLLSIYQDLLRRMPVLPIGSSGSTERFRFLDVADPRRDSRPDWALEMAEEREFYRELKKTIQKALEKLPSVTRQVVRMHVFQGLSGEEICRIMGFRKRQRVYDEMAKAKRQLANILGKAGVDGQKANLAIGWLDEEVE